MTKSRQNSKVKSHGLKLHTTKEVSVEPVCGLGILSQPTGGGIPSILQRQVLSRFLTADRPRSGFHCLPQGCDTDATASTLGCALLPHDPHAGPRQSSTLSFVIISIYIL